jgi:BirA family biotin operon repressor/biotin-[acetyl-CoA-carboxylase] ligase
MKIDSDSIAKQLEAEFADSFAQICVLDVIDSSNAEAARRIEAGQESSQLIVARSQSAGRGRRGRQWLSPLDAGLYISLTRSFSQSPTELQGLSLVTALTVQETVHKLGLSGARVKWPNDVLVADKKLAGILLETCRHGEGNVIIFGIGINLALPDQLVKDLDRPVTDLQREMGREVTQSELLSSLLTQWLANVELFQQRGFAAFVERWNACDRYRGAQIDIINGSRRQRGISRGVNRQAALLLDTGQGLEVISGGEVSPSLRPVDAGECSATGAVSHDS